MAGVHGKILQAKAGGLGPCNELVLATGYAYLDLHGSGSLRSRTLQDCKSGRKLGGGLQHWMQKGIPIVSSLTINALRKRKSL